MGLCFQCRVRVNGEGIPGGDGQSTGRPLTGPLKGWRRPAWAGRTGWGHEEQAGIPPPQKRHVQSDALELRKVIILSSYA